VSSGLRNIETPLQHNHLIVVLFLSISVFVIAALYPDHMLLASASIALLGGSLWLMQKTTNLQDWKRPTITGVCYLYFLVTLFIPSFFVFVDRDEPYRSRFLFGVASILITLPLGILVANSVYRFTKQDLSAYLDKPLETVRETAGSTRAFLMLLAFALGVTALYLTEVREIPLFYILKNPGEFLVASELRYDALLGLESRFRYIYVVTRDVLYPFLVLVAFGRYLTTRATKWAILFSVTIAGALAYASLTIQKAPVAVLFFLLLVFYLLYQRGVVNKRLVAIGLICVIAFPTVIFLQVFEPDAGLSGALVFVANRVFHGPSEVLYFYFEVFPSKHPYLYDRSIGKLTWLTGNQEFDTPNYVGVYGYPGAPDYVHASAPFIGDLNAGFGLAGVVLGGFVAGFVMEAIQIYIVRKRKTVENFATYIFEIYGLLLLNHTAFPTILVSYGVVPVLVLAWMLPRLEGSFTAFSLAFRRA
jgi:oligosaccharide repeat unit polymerase